MFCESRHNQWKDYEIMHEYYGSVEVFVLLCTKHNSDCTPCCIENTSL
jgi:hypothetical protein